ncbi:MAG: SPOR domain-containing protein [Marinicella sp.]|nr:SPOR domain-containing protein [Xanthomonadales bacterium]
MDQELKQRMIGAAVIIALAVIFVPMLFDGDIEEKHNKNISINIPAEPDSNLEVKKFSLDKPVSENVELPAGDVDLTIDKDQPVLVTREPVVIQKPISNNTQDKDQLLDQADNGAKQTETEVAVKQTKPIEQRPVEQNSAEQKPVVTKPAATKPANEPVTKQPSNQALSQAYRVKLGSFSQKANAEKVKTSLLQKNIKAIVEYNPGLKLYRVWSEEIYQSETKAEQYVAAVNQLKLNIGTPKVITLTASEVENMAIQGQLGWVVQLGSFGDKNNAIDLRNKVNAAGFKSFVDEVSNSNGKLLYRLRVGPLMEKTDAEKTQAELKTKLKLDGLVKNHELSQVVN